ncbi:MAG: glycosyltransferase family 2 protein [Parvularculaceae bacterium]
MSHVVVSPCRNEAAYMRATLASMAAQTARPDLWVIVDDGSSDETPTILAEFAATNDWVRIVAKPDRGRRAVGPGVVEAFYFGLDTVDLDAFDFVTKLDLDLDLPPRYFEALLEKMAAEPRLGSASGKPYFRGSDGALRSEKRGDEMSVGMTKFYRTACFRDIGGFVREVMWDGIDCHKCRQLGWIARSFDEPDLRFEHLRAMGSSEKGVLTGRARHGYGQYFMGSDPAYFVLTAIFRMQFRPYVVGGLASMWGYFGAMARRAPRLDEPDLRRFIQAYQRRAPAVGKRRATEELEASGREIWPGGAQRTGG